VLVHAVLSRLDAVARLILREPDRAEDAVQDALVRAWRDLPTLRDPDRFDAWLHRLLVRSCMDEARRSRRHRSSVTWSPAHEPVAVDTSGSILDRDQLDRGFRRLSLDHRTVVVLHHYLDLPLDEVAEALGIPVGTVASRLHYAMRALRAALDADARSTTRKAAQ